MVISPSRVTSRASKKAMDEAALPMVANSDVCTSLAVLVAGTVMLTMMITLAAVTLTVTSDLSTRAASAMFCCRLEVSE
jgi:hypothetical protein